MSPGSPGQKLPTSLRNKERQCFRPIVNEIQSVAVSVKAAAIAVMLKNLV